MKGNMIQLELMTFDIDFHFRRAKASIPAVKVKLNLRS